MTLREVAIAKLQQLPEPLLQEVSDFIDSLMDEGHKVQTDPSSERAEAWVRWFESVEHLEIEPTESVSDYQKLLLAKYRQQGLKLCRFSLLSNQRSREF